jgi:hypothetical protein
MMMAALLATGCDREVRDGHVWAGFNYSWEQISHRVALTRVIMNEDGSVELGMIGGDWSTGGSFEDFPVYRVRTQSVSAQGFAVVHGETELIVGPDGTATVAASVTDEVVAGMRHQVIVLRGFEMDTDIEQPADYPSDYDPALGYTSRGFGFSLSEPTVDGDTLSFDVGATVRWGPQDRDDVNSAIPHATTAVSVAWTAIGYRGRSELESLSATVELEHDPPFSEHEPIGEGMLDFQPSDRTPEVVGLQSFDLLIEDQAGTDGGVYLRRFGVEIVQDEDGTPSYSLGECTNSSIAEEIGVITTVQADVMRIWLKDKAASLSVSVLEGSHDVGDASASAK